MAENSWLSNRILIVGGSVSGKANSLFNVISQQPDMIKFKTLLKTLWNKISIFN